MSDGTITWRRLWAETESLVAKSPAAGRPVARWICEEASGFEGDEFVEVLDQPATERRVHHLDQMVARVQAGEPLQYVLGRWAFRHLDLMVDRRVLIPRPETEQLVELALGKARSIDRPLACADLGTGSGAIGLSLVAELPLDGTTVWLTDLSSDALDVARANAVGVGRRSVNARFAHGSWFDALPIELRGQLHVVVANPPYIADDDPEVERGVREWEPMNALFAGADGLDDIRQIVADASSWLAPGGWLLLEIGHRQGPAVVDLMRAAGLDDVTIEHDLTGRQRFAVGRGSVEAGSDLSQQ
jgi:release factor glutamine methyltransferase